MVTLHSFDEEPEKQSCGFGVPFDFDGILYFYRDEDGNYWSYGSYISWEDIKALGCGWLYESELIQLIKNGTRSE